MSEHSTPRRTSSGLAAIGPSDLLSPSEIGPLVRQTSGTQKALAPPSISQAAASPSDQDTQPQDEAPSGTMSSSARTHPTLHEAAEAGGPAGSLVSAQQPAAAPDSPVSLPADSALVSQESQLHTPLVSPAADMASRAYPLPVVPVEDGGLSTPQSSGHFDAHIAAAPTPYPSLASDMSQPGSPASSKGGGAAHLPLGDPSGAHAAGSNPDQKSRFALTSSGQGVGAEEYGTVMDAQAVVPSRGANDDQAGALPIASHVPSWHGSTAALQQPVADRAQDPSPPEAKPNSTGEQHQQAQATSDIHMAGLKLDDADSEQLQMALALSLGQQEAETAQDVAQGAMHDQTNVSASGPASVTDSAEPMLPAPDKQNCGTDAPATAVPGLVSLEGNEAGHSSTEAPALPAAPSAASSGQTAEPADHSSSSSVPHSSSQPATAAHEASSSSGAQAGPSQQAADEHRLISSLAAHADADARQQEEPSTDQQAAQPDDDITGQQSTDGAAFTGKLNLQACWWMCRGEMLHNHVHAAAVLLVVTLT